MRGDQADSQRSAEPQGAWRIDNSWAECPLMTITLWVFVKSCGTFLCFSDRGEHAGENFQPQVLFLLQSIRPALDDANLVVHTFNETERHLAERGNPIPMTLNHFRKLLIGLEPLPLESGLPVLEELARPRLARVTP